jgi:hypothetical protein
MIKSMVSVFLPLIVVAASSGAHAVQAPVVSYQFNTGPNGAAVMAAIDSGPNHLNGAVTGALTYSNDTPPSGGGKFSLNATADYDYVTVGDTAVLDPTASFTLSAWAMPTGGQNPDGVGDSIVNKHEAAGSGVCIISYSLSYNATTQQFFAEICNSANTNAPQVIVASTDVYPVGQWHQLMLEFHLSAKNTASLTLLVDGKIEGAQTIKKFPGIYYSSGPFQIGAENSGSGDQDFYRRNFYGYIDDVKLTVSP